MNDYMQLWLDRAEKYPDELIHRKPSETEWSLQQVLLHIIQIQDVASTVLQKQLANSKELRPTQLKTWYRYALLKLALKSSKKFKAPKVVANVSNEKSLSELRQLWEKSYRNISQIVNNFPKELENKLIFRHPVIGWINIGQTTGFMLDHLKHHQKQIESLYSQLDSK